MTRQPSKSYIFITDVLFCLLGITETGNDLSKPGMVKFKLFLEIFDLKKPFTGKECDWSNSDLKNEESLYFTT
jgi:hypothetical protein